MKLLGRTNGKQVIASISHYDFISLGEGEDYISVDGGAILTNHYAGYSRGWGKVVWFEVPQDFAELYKDYNFNHKNRKFGIWNIEDVRILEENEWPNVDSIEEKAENFIWGQRGPLGDQPLKYVFLKDCSKEHLQNILKNVPNIHEETEEVIKYLLKTK